MLAKYEKCSVKNLCTDIIKATFIWNLCKSPCLCVIFQSLVIALACVVPPCYWFFDQWPIECLTASSSDFLVTSNRTMSSFFFVSLLRAWSWVTMVISQPFTWEEENETWALIMMHSYLPVHKAPSCGLFLLHTCNILSPIRRPAMSAGPFGVILVT